MRERKGRYGSFYGCSNYPKCRHTMKRLPPQNNNDIEKLLEEALNEKPKSVFVPSKYQQAIFDFVKNGTGNAVVEACPGSGKSTTLQHAADLIPNGIYLAFNRRIVKDIKSKLQINVPARTIHGLGSKNIIKHFGKVKVDNRKIYWIIQDYLENESELFVRTIEVNIGAVIKLVGLCKGTMLKPITENLNYLVDNYNVNTNGDWQQIYRMVRIAFQKSIKETWRIDYNDMVYFPASGIVPCEKFDWLLIDELQDLNKAQAIFVQKSLSENGRVIGVGDTWQAIYGWRGSDTQAIENFTKIFNAQTLPLSISYRCPRSHIEFVKSRFPKSNIEVWENAIEGKIISITNQEFLHTVKSGDMVLCRTNAPLVAPAFELIRQGVKAIILGRDIGKGLIDLIEKTEKKNSINDLVQLLYALNEYRNAEISKLIAQHKETKAQHFDDSIETIYALADSCATNEELKERIKNVFSDDEQGIVFSSCHKAKGTEAERVFILKYELMPHPMALKSMNPETIQQEKHVEYVALTRSKSELYFVGE